MDAVESLLLDYISREGTVKPDMLPIGKYTKLIESGILDSLSVLNLVVFLEDKFGIKIAPEDIVQENFETVGAIRRYLDTKQGK